MIEWVYENGINVFTTLYFKTKVKVILQILFERKFKVYDRILLYSSKSFVDAADVM